MTEEKDTNMGTMPIPDLVRALREKVPHDNPILALTLGVLAGRLSQEYERAEELEVERDAYAEMAADLCVIDKVTEVLGPQTLTSVVNYKRMNAFRSAVVGWRENDWPEGFDRRTAELVAEAGYKAEQDVEA